MGRRKFRFHGCHGPARATANADPCGRPRRARRKSAWVWPPPLASSRPVAPRPEGNGPPRVQSGGCFRPIPQRTFPSPRRLKVGRSGKRVYSCLSVASCGRLGTEPFSVNTPMEIVLSQGQQDLWEQYLALESRGTRDAKLGALSAFVEELLQAPKVTWKRWALQLAAQIVDDAADLPVRRPLFERVLFPALLAGLEGKSPGSARWLAGFRQQLFNCPPCMEQLGHTLCSEWTLLEMAVEHDPEDVRARQRLIRVMAGHLRYTLHELPAGVLFGVDGASVDECDELLAELDEFRALLAAEGRTGDYETLVAECVYHYRAYKQYLLERPQNKNYRGFLEARGGRPAEGGTPAACSTLVPTFR